MSKPSRGIRVVPPPGSPPGCCAWLYRRCDGDFHLTLRGPDGRLLRGCYPPAPGRPVTLWPERRSRPRGDAAAAIARAKAIAARRTQPGTLHEDEGWIPPVNMPEPRIPRTPEGAARTLRKLRRRKQRFEMIQMADASVEMPLVVPGPPVSIEEGKAELNRRYELAVLRQRFPDASDEMLSLM